MGQPGMAYALQCKHLHNQITTIEMSNLTQLTLFTWVNIVYMSIFTVNRKGMAKFYTEKRMKVSITYKITVVLKRFIQLVQ